MAVPWVSWDYLPSIVYMITLIIAFVIALLFYKNLLKRMVEARRIRADTAVKLYRAAELVVIMLILISAGYLWTRSHVLLLLVIGVFLIILASAWHILADLAYYYVVLFNGHIKKGDLIVLRDGRIGRVEDVRSLGVIISNPGPPRRTYFVPYRELFSRGFTLSEELCIARIRVYVEGVRIEQIEALKDLIERKASEASSHAPVLAPVERSLRSYVDEVTNNSVTYTIPFITTQTEGREFRFTHILHNLALTLREAGFIKFRVWLERPECPGGKQGDAQA